MAKERDLKTVLQELQTLQGEYSGKPMPEDVATQFDTLAKEAKQIQDAVDRENTVKEIERGVQKRTPDPVVPQPDDRKDQGVVGYMSLGDFAVASDGLKSFVNAGMPKSYWEFASANISVFKRKGQRKPVVGLKRAMMEAIQQKAPPTIADRVIPYDRDNDLVLNEEFVPPRLRDVLNIVQTNAGSVEWVRRNTRTRGAATQDETITEGVQGLKGEHTQAYTLVTTAIRTHAVWQPVTEQQLADWPQLSQLINADLMDDLNQYFEEQVLYGNGSGTNFDGLLHDTNVDEAREESGDTIIDVIRRGITDIRRSQFNPNAIIMDPIDWEEVVLEKGSDEHYIWVVVTEAGVPRIWGLPVIETVKMENDDDERNILIGDFNRGATLYDRMSAAVAVGWIDDQFIRNMRTLRLEARAGFAIRRPDAFRKIETVAASS